PVLAVLGEGGVGDIGRVEPAPFVFDADLEPLRGDGVTDADLFRRVELVAVLDRVDEGLFEGQLDVEHVPLAVPGRLQRIPYFVLDATDLGQVARDGAVDGDAVLGHGVPAAGAGSRATGGPRRAADPSAVRTSSGRSARP